VGGAHLAGPGEDWACHAGAGAGSRSERAAGTGSSAAETCPGKARVEATRGKEGESGDGEPFYKL